MPFLHLECVYRIGQISKTYVHRYIIHDTIEEQIDKLRQERQESRLEEDVTKKKDGFIIGAGGIDGGLSHKELYEILHKDKKS